jgi:hypothetical protein
VDIRLAVGDVDRSLGVDEGLLLAALDYVLDERVVEGVLLGEQAAARVVGHRDDYRAEARVRPFGRTRCTCGRPQPCRHAVAVALAYLRGSTPFLPLADGGEGWAETVFALVAGRPDPLAPLARARGPEDRPEPDWAALADLPAGSGAERVTAWLAASAAEGGALERAARWLAERAAEGAPLPAASARRLAHLYPRLAPGPLADAVAAWLGALGGEAREAAWTALEHAAWAAAEGETGGRREAERAVSLLCRLAQEQGDEAVLAVARAHRQACAPQACEAEALARLGRREEAARAAQAAYLHAEGEEAERLYVLMRDLGQAGVAGVADFLRAAWEAQPTWPALRDLLAMGDASQRARMRARAEEVLVRQRRFDLLCTLAEGEGDLEAAVRWALREDGRTADAPACRRLAEAVARGRPLAAVELLGAAYRRATAREDRRRALSRARSISRRHPEIARHWPILHRRWFPAAPPRAHRTAAAP